MAVDDDLTYAWRTRVAEVQANQAQAQANLAAARAKGDSEAIGDAIEQIGWAETRIRNLIDMQQRHQASQQQQQPAADRRDGVDLDPVDAMKICGLDPNNADDVEVYNSGYRRLQALKARGMYRE